LSDINTDLNTSDNVTFVSGDTNNNGALDVGETWVYSATHTVTQSELDSNGSGNGFIDNTATAHSDQTGNVSDSAEVPIQQNPSMSIDKIALPGQIANQAGQTLNYTIDVKNTGNIALTGIVVTDLNTDLNTSDTVNAILSGGFNSGDVNHNNILDVGETWHYTATHIVQQSEIDTNGSGNGLVDNTATADSDQTAPVSDSATVPIEQHPAMSIDKVALPGQDADHVGEVLNYTIDVSNTGNMTLTGVTVTDVNTDFGTTDPVTAVLSGGFNSGDINHNGKLDVGETWHYTATHTVTSQDLSTNGAGNGEIDNTATADSDQTNPVSDSAQIPVVQHTFFVPAGFSNIVLYMENDATHKVEKIAFDTAGLGGLDTNHDGFVSGSEINAWITSHSGSGGLGGFTDLIALSIHNGNFSGLVQGTTINTGYEPANPHGINGPVVAGANYQNGEILHNSEGQLVWINGSGFEVSNINPTTSPVNWLNSLQGDTIFNVSTNSHNPNPSQITSPQLAGTILDPHTQAGFDILHNQTLISSTAIHP
jgi:hypothetical protein